MCLDEFELWEREIDDTQLKPCMQTILSDLKQQNNGVAEIIKKFATDTVGFNWTVKDGSLNGANASTSQQYNTTNSTVTTTFDSFRMKDASDLSVARTILHESIHAYIIAYSRVNPTNVNNTFPKLMEDLLKSRYASSNDTQHAEFVRNYVNDIALSLMDYGSSKGYNLSSQFYKDLAWGGLTHWAKRDSQGNIIKDSNGNTIYEETSWFKFAYTNSSDRTRVTNIIAIEQTGKDSQGNSKNQKGSNANC